ncbi:hypothetical protein [Alkaliphilus peptidifermentans]|uniref:Uncharacterized protein n=1 Tax=Alkaliphilus peptidifermentans DSM 18978 TaxID=1120976 RepID=A0A1G5JV01_9FIRM|nr:hypothetical protein [Alkaliphilus peptidifermentans]SCY92223.1 hypothetical protein SAMN03080606_03049 [Alkaliphilus peptidifermentans DSM 18978]
MKNKTYYPNRKFDPLTLQNIEEKNKIHQLEQDSFEMSVDNLKKKATVNELR